MTYDTPHALRTAIEARIRTESQDTGISPDRLRRRIIFQRILSRLQRAEPGRWVLKGGMALEVRLHDAARLTKDIDVGLREAEPEPADLRDRLVEAFADDTDGDGFEFAVRPPQALAQDDAGDLTWRIGVDVTLAGRPFGAIKIDVSPRGHELETTDVVALPNALSFAGFETVEIEIVDVHRHAAEKLHAMLRDFGERENSRVRDLVDLMLLLEHEFLAVKHLAAVATQVWAERDATPPPAYFPMLPASWPASYEHLAADNGVEPATFDEAYSRAAALWAQMFPTQET